MCELFAVSSKKTININKYLKEFYSHSNEHPHGWGLAIMRTNESIIEKQPQKAIDSERLTQILTKPVLVENAFAHIRLATIGYTDTFNCHPFSQHDNSGRTWTLMHNGTIFKNEQLNKYIPQQIGETDSERILLHIIDTINQEQDEIERQLNPKECNKIIQELITELACNNKLNIMIYNGDCLFAHGNYQNSLYYLKKEDTIFISSQPLSQEDWKLLPINKIYTIRNSEIINESPRHNHEFKMTEDNFNFLFENMSPEDKQNVINNFGDLNHAWEYYINNQ